MAILSDHHRVGDTRIDACRFGRGMTQALLQGEFTHPSFPHLGGMSMPEGMRSHPWLTHVQPLAMTIKQLEESMVAKWIASSHPASDNEKYQSAELLSQSILHDVIAIDVQGFVIVH